MYPMSPFVGIPHNRLVFLHLYSDLLALYERLSVSYYNKIEVLAYRTFGLQIIKIRFSNHFYAKSDYHTTSTIQIQS
jgi:hypothetical protein